MDGEAQGSAMVPDQIISQSDLVDAAALPQEAPATEVVSSAQEESDPSMPRQQAIQEDDNSDPGRQSVQQVDSTEKHAEASVVIKQEEDFETAEATLEQPAASTTESANAQMSNLPADIEHILSLGAAEPDPAEDDGAPPKTNYEQVVRDLRQRAGFMSQDDVVKDEDVSADVKVEDSNEVLDSQAQRQRQELETVRLELESQGIVRPELVKEDEDDSSDSDSDESMKALEDDAASSSSSGDDVDVSTKPMSRNRKQNKGRKARADTLSDDDLSDDDVNALAAPKHAPRTEHELEEAVPALPEIEKLPEGVELAPFGKVQSVIETVVVIKADTTGSYRVLDEGTICCWEDRSVAGSIFETFGSVQQPFYSLRFPSSALPSPEVFQIGRAIFYAPTLAQFVFTREIRAIKGSDASNVWDEEVGAGEIEFSDDEAEQEYRRAQKADRRARNGTASATPGPQGSNRRLGSRAPSVNSGPAEPSGLLSLPARPSTVSYADLDDTPSADIHLPAPMSRLNGVSESVMGSAPPSGRDGRKMFERDTGRSGAGEAEFEFSDGEDFDNSDENDDSRDLGDAPLHPPLESMRGGRGRGRGAPRGRGAGGTGRRGDRGAGRGAGRERGRGRGRGRGGAIHGGEQGASARPMAGLPPRPVSDLPSKPSFTNSASGETGYDPTAPAQANVAPSPFDFGGPSAPPPAFFGGAPFAPQEPSGSAPLHHGGPPSYYPSVFPQQFPPPPPAGGPSPGPGGHFNPRFFGPQGGPPSGFPPHGQFAFAPQGYPPPQAQQFWTPPPQGYPPYNNGQHQ